MWMTIDEFYDVADKAVEAIPQRLRDAMDNVAIVAEAEPPHGQPRSLLGLYEGVPLTERGEAWATGTLPDRITLYWGPLMRMTRSRSELEHEIKVTVVHEIAHHFGIDDDALHELGWG